MIWVNQGVEIVFNIVILPLIHLKFLHRKMIGNKLHIEKGRLKEDW